MVDAACAGENKTSPYELCIRYIVTCSTNRGPQKKTIVGISAAHSNTTAAVNTHGARKSPIARPSRPPARPCEAYLAQQLGELPVRLIQPLLVGAIYHEHYRLTVAQKVEPQITNSFVSS